MPQDPNFVGPQHPTLLALSQLDGQLTELENSIRSLGGDYAIAQGLDTSGQGVQLLAQRQKLMQLRDQFLQEAEEKRLGTVPGSERFFGKAASTLASFLGYPAFVPKEEAETSEERPDLLALSAKAGVPFEQISAPFSGEVAAIPEAKRGKDVGIELAGAAAIYGPAGILSAPVAAVEGAPAATALGRLGQVALGQLKQEALFVPSTIASTEGLSEAAGYSAFGVGLGTILGLHGQGKAAEEIGARVMKTFIPATEESPEIASKALIDAGVDEKNILATELLGDIAPSHEFLPRVADHVANGEAKALESYGESIRLRNKTADEIAQESDDLASKVYTADGPISSEAAMQDKLSKAFLDTGIASPPSSVLDQVRPSASLAEREYVLLQGDEDSFRNVSARFKTPSRVVERIIEESKALSPEQKGQKLFNSLVEQAEIARLKGDVDVFQVPRKSPHYEKYLELKITQEELNQEFRSMDDAVREAIDRPQGAAEIIPFKRPRDLEAEAKAAKEELGQAQIDRVIKRLFAESDEFEPTTPKGATGVQVPAEWTPGQQRAAELFAKGKAVLNFETLQGVRDRRLLAMSQVLESGDFDKFDKMLNIHVGETALAKMRDTIVSDYSNLLSSTNLPLMRDFLRNTEGLRGNLGNIPGLATHFPQLEIILDKSNQSAGIKGILASFENAADPDKRAAAEWIVRHEYGHALEKFLKQQVSVELKNLPEEARVSGAWKNTSAGKILQTINEGASLHDARAWDPIAKAVDDVKGKPWPKDIPQRSGKPPSYDAVHDEDPVEKFADVVALMTTKEGRESLNPLVRQKLEPLFGRISEPYAPKYALEDLQKRFYEGGPGYLGMQIKQAKGPSNTVKNAGKVLTSSGDEARIRFSAINSATDPETGITPKYAQEALGNAGPVAAAGAGQILEGAGPFAKPKVLENLEKAKAGDKRSLKDYFMAFKTARAAGMLTGPVTHGANALVNSMMAFIQPGITTGAAIADIVKVATGLQKQRKVFFGEALAQIQGQLHDAFSINSALPSGLREFAHEVRHSKDFSTSLIDSVTGKEINAIGHLAAGLKNKVLSKSLGVIGQGAELIFKPLKAVDNFFFNINFAGGIYKQAYAKSIKEGKTLPQALNEVITQVNKFDQEAANIVEKSRVHAQGEIGGIADPDLEFIAEKEAQQIARQYRASNVPVSIEEAKLGAERSIFVAREGKKLDQFLSTLDNWDEKSYGLVSMPLPFRRTPAYIVREGLRTSPFGFLGILAETLGTKSVALDSREASLRLGQAIFGTAAFYILWQNVANGNIKGGPAYDPNKAHRDTYRAAGKRQDSLYLNLFGKTYTVPLDRLNPIGGQIQAMIQYKQELDRAQAAGEPLDPYYERAAGFAMDLTRNLGVGDFSRNLGDLFEAFDSRKQSGVVTRYLNNLGASLVPVAVKQAIRAGEIPGTEPGLIPGKEDTPGIAGAGAALGVSGQERIGLFGEKQKISKLEAATGVGELRNDPVVNKMIEVGAYHQSPVLPKELKDRGAKEQVAFQVGKGRLQRQFVERIVLNPGFAKLDPEAQKRLINKAFTRASELADKRAKAVIRLKGTINENVIFKGRT